MSCRVVCISRASVAGGEHVGHLVAERLGYRYVDDEVILLASEKAGLDPAVVAKAEQHSSLVTRLMDALVAPPMKEEGSARAVADSDRERQRYLERFFDVKQELPTHYDLVINTDVLRLGQAVGAIVGAATA